MRGEILAFISVALFSTYIIFGKVLLSSISPFVILFVNQVLAGVVLFLILDIFRKIRSIEYTSKKDIKYIFIISLSSSVIAPLLFMIGLKLTSATNTALIVRSESIFTSLMAVYFLKERVTIQQIIGAIVMFFGVFIIATNNFALGLSVNLGDMLILASALLYAFCTILYKKYMHQIPADIIVSLRNIFGAAMLFVISLIFLDFTVIAHFFAMEFFLSLIGMVVLATILGQYFWYKALEKTSATNVSIAALFSPLITIVYIIIFLKESITTSQILGGISIIIGMIILEIHFRKVHTDKKHKLHLKLKHWHHI